MLTLSCLLWSNWSFRELQSIICGKNDYERGAPTSPVVFKRLNQVISIRSVQKIPRKTKNFRFSSLELKLLTYATWKQCSIKVKGSFSFSHTYPLSTAAIRYPLYKTARHEKMKSFPNTPKRNNLKTNLKHQILCRKLVTYLNKQRKLVNLFLQTSYKLKEIWYENYAKEENNSPFWLPLNFQKQLFCKSFCKTIDNL